MQLVETSTGIFTAEMSFISTGKCFFWQIRTAGMWAGRVAGLEHFGKALLLHISELWPLLGWQPFMYLVTLITVKVLMLARPKSRVKNPSTWRDRGRRWWVTLLRIVRFQPSSASLLPFHFHILRFLRFFANLLQTQDFSLRSVQQDPEIKTETFITAVIPSQQLDWVPCLGRLCFNHGSC